MEVSMSEQEKLDWVSFAIQEALNGNNGKLMQALELVEDLREKNNTHTYEDER
jgi:hypothetical protein